MKKSLIILVVGMLAGASSYALETENVFENSIWNQEVVKEVDFSTLDFKKVEVAELPEQIQAVIKSMEEAGVVLKEAAIAKTESEVFFRLITTESGKNSVTYLNAEGEILKVEDL